MILSVEGVDCSGKTSLWSALRNEFPYGVFVPKQDVPRGVTFPDAMLVQLRLWSALYDMGKLYVVDRGPWISGPVYDLLYGRGRCEYLSLLPAWKRRVVVAYVSVPEAELLRRLESRGDRTFRPEHVGRALDLYAVELSGWHHTCIAGTGPASVLAAKVAEHVRGEM